jgi:hypothetical protein
MKNEFDREHRFTRGDFFMELIDIWGTVADKLNHAGTPIAIRESKKYEAAIELLKNTYRTNELFDIKQCFRKINNANVRPFKS